MREEGDAKGKGSEREESTWKSLGGRRGDVWEREYVAVNVVEFVLVPAGGAEYEVVCACLLVDNNMLHKKY